MVVYGGAEGAQELSSLQQSRDGHLFFALCGRVFSPLSLSSLYMVSLQVSKKAVALLLAAYRASGSNKNGKESSEPASI